MQQIKGCPFCGIRPVFKYNNETGLITLECKVCTAKNMIISCSGDTYADVINNWNNRVSENYTNVIGCSNYGYLILDDGEVLDCELYSHKEVLINKFNLNVVSIEDFVYHTFLYQHKIIKITGTSKELAIDIPESYTKKQIDKLIDIVNLEIGALDLDRFYVYNKHTEEHNIFYTVKAINDYINKLI